MSVYFTNESSFNIEPKIYQKFEIFIYQFNRDRASARTLDPESISVPAQAPARGKLCRRLRVLPREKVQSQAASAPTPHPVPRD